MATFALHDVGVRLGGRDVLAGVTLDLAERRIGLVGPNGSGKSTLARLLNGLLLPTTGTVHALGLDTRRDGRAVMCRVGFVFQDPDAQIVYPTVAEDVAFGLRARRVPASERGPRVEAALARLGIGHLRDAPAHVLSGGEKQLLALAGVLVLEPEALVMDEPTTLLDLRNARRIGDAIAALDVPVVVATHDLDLVRGFDRVVVLADGGVAADDAPGPALARYVESIA